MLVRIVGVKPVSVGKRQTRYLASPLDHLELFYTVTLPTPDDVDALFGQEIDVEENLLEISFQSEIDKGLGK